MGLFGNLFDSEKRHFHQAEVLADKVLKLEESYAQKSDDESVFFHYRIDFQIIPSSTSCIRLGLMLEHIHDLI